MNIVPQISILVITHDQRLSLERCLDSILRQEISVPYEIIVSDDRSADGTEEYVNSLSKSEQVTSIKTLLGLYYVRCNSDDCSPITTGQRISWNRLSAYRIARGKYFVNVDADDFLMGTDLYQSEFEVLECHPECSMVQTRTLLLDEGVNLNEVRDCFPFSEKLTDGAVFSLEEVLQYSLRGMHQSYMYRRRPQDDMYRLFGLRFDDVYLTYYHLQFGPVVFLDMTGYVWVQYPRSDSHSLSKDEKGIAYGLIPLTLARLFKESRFSFIRCRINALWDTVSSVPVYPELGKVVRRHFSMNDNFLFRFYAENHHGLFSRLRYRLVYLLLRVMKHGKMNSNFFIYLLYRGMA